MTDHEFFAEITGRIEGKPAIDDDRGVATAKIHVTQNIETGRGPKTWSMRLYVWTTEEQWREELRLYRDGEPINVFCKQMRPGRGTRVDRAGRRWPGRERFIIDYLEPGGEESRELFRVEMTGRLVSDPYSGAGRFGRFAQLELFIDDRARHQIDGAATANLFQARVLGQPHAAWLRDNLHRDDEVMLVSTALVPGQAQPNRALESPDEYLVGAPIFNIAERPILQDRAQDATITTADAAAIREARVLAGLTMDDHRSATTGRVPE